LFKPLTFALVAFAHLTSGYHPKAWSPKGTMSGQAAAFDDTALEATSVPRSTAGTPTEVHADLRHLGHEPALVDKIMKKRQEEMARRTKLQNTRSFRTGVPHDVLNEQVAAKKAAAQKIKDEDDYHDRYRIISDQVAQVCESIRHEATRERQKATTTYSMTNHRKETRREFDLSDPNVIKSERPVRDGDNDSRLGPSSIQCFEGEDFLAKKRKEEMGTQIREWLEYQKAEKQDAKDREVAIDQQYDQAMVVANEMRGLCEKANIEEQAAEKREEAAENKALAAIHHERRQKNRLKDALAAQAHVQSEMQSDRMMELADYKLGVDGRLMKAEYKRLSWEEEQNVYDTNARQVLELQARKKAEKSGGGDEAADNYAADMVLNTLESAKANAERQRRMKIDDFNKSLVKQKKDFDVLEKQAYMSYDHMEIHTSTANQW